MPSTPGLGIHSSFSVCVANKRLLTPKETLGKRATRNTKTSAGFCISTEPRPMEHSSEPLSLLAVENMSATLFVDKQDKGMRILCLGPQTWEVTSSEGTRSP